MTDKLSIPPLNNEWLDYSKFGSAISFNSKLKILPIRAPLENPKALEFLQEDELWTWKEVKTEINSYFQSKFNKNAKILTVIDLTGSDIDAEKYYKGSNLLERHNIYYDKILVRGTLGSKIPDEYLFSLFNQSADRTCKLCENIDELKEIPVLLVHCTHGLNRTGLFICNYLVKKCGMNPEEAIKVFEEARGYSMKYDFFKNYIRSLSNTS